MGQEIPHAVAPASSRGRKFIRAASSLLGLGDEDATGMIDISSKRRHGRKHTGHGRRDSLDPVERTRVLRMLRDEGGRRADEESHLELIDVPGQSRPPMPPPVAEHKRSIVSGIEDARSARMRANDSSYFDHKPTAAMSPSDAKQILDPVRQRSQEKDLVSFLDSPPAGEKKEVDLSSLLSGNTVDDDDDDNEFDEQATRVAGEDLLAKIKGKPSTPPKTKTRKKRSISQVEFDFDND